LTIDGAHLLDDLIWVQPLILEIVVEEYADYDGNNLANSFIVDGILSTDTPPVVINLHPYPDGNDDWPRSKEGAFNIR
jgi:hypothetical protein